MILKDLEHKVLGFRASSYLLTRSDKEQGSLTSQLGYKVEIILQAEDKLGGEGLHYLTARAVPEGHHHHWDQAAEIGSYHKVHAEAVDHHVVPAGHGELHDSLAGVF